MEETCSGLVADVQFSKGSCMPEVPGIASTRALLRAAQYVRMSTEHQQYSVDNQAEAIRRFAAAEGMEIEGHIPTKAKAV